MNTNPQIVITGLGTIGTAGLGKRALAEALADGSLQFREIDGSAGYHGARSAKRAGLVDKFNIADWIPPMAARRMSMPSRFAGVAARMALEDAGLELDEGNRLRAGVALATAFGPALYTQKILDQIFGTGPEAASPALFTECVANAPASQVSIRSQLRGPNFTLSSREAGPLMALARGASEVRAGRADWALAGSVEEMTPLLHGILDRFRSLARESKGLEERPRPFDRRRNGLLAGEGAGVVVLEEEQAAIERQADILATVRAWGSGFDYTASNTNWGHGSDSLAAGIQRSLERAGLKPGEIDVVISGASGSIQGDRLEAHVLRAIWGDAALPPVIAPKGVTGEYGGGFLGAAVLAASGETFDGNAGFSEVDPELGIEPAGARSMRGARRFLVTGLASGGAASWLVLERRAA